MMDQNLPVNPALNHGCSPEAPHAEAGTVPSICGAIQAASLESDALCSVVSQMRYFTWNFRGIRDENFRKF